MAQLTRMVEKLCELSRKGYVNPHGRVDWPTTFDGAGWFTSPELISLYGTKVWTNLTEDEKKRLSFYEAVNFFSLNIHGEKSLIEGLAHRLYRKNTQDISAYLHHFLDEENKHMIYFGEFCMRYAGKIYADRKMTFGREYAPGEEDFLFFAKVLIFEEIVDAYNQRMAKDERLAPIARQINLLHHLDETRHLAFGRRLVSELFKRYSPAWSEATLQGVRGYLGNYFVATWKEYYNPDVYRDAGLASPYDLYETAFHGPAGNEHRKKISQGCIRYLLENNILEEEPAL
jgi:hypothetical protein